LTIKDLANTFIQAKQALVDVGELAGLTWGDYKTACDEVVAAFGKNRLLVHHRLKICDKYKITYSTKELSFPSRERAIQWVIDNQLGSRMVKIMVPCMVESPV
jgi:hypothetical protein